MFRRQKEGGRERKKVMSLPFVLIIFLSAILILSLLSAAYTQTKTVKAVKKETPSQQKKSGQMLPAKKVTTEKVSAQKASGPLPKVESKPPVNQAILKENKFLEEELSLAKNPQYYFVINLKDKKIELRARGMVLKSWTASRIRYSGKPVPLKVTTLAQKSALNPPKRKMIKPGETQESTAPTATQPAEPTKSKEPNSTATGTTDTFEVEALEITDMPGSYELILDNGLQISVRSKAGSKEKMKQNRELILWYTWLPIKNFLFKKKEPKPRMILYFDNPRDAQGIYWAFIDGIKGIIWLP